jgi:hypothetical protein
MRKENSGNLFIGTGRCLDKLKDYTKRGNVAKM